MWMCVCAYHFHSESRSQKSRLNEFLHHPLEILMWTYNENDYLKGRPLFKKYKIEAIFFVWNVIKSLWLSTHFQIEMYLYYTTSMTKSIASLIFFFSSLFSIEPWKSKACQAFFFWTVQCRTQHPDIAMSMSLKKPVCQTGNLYTHIEFWLFRSINEFNHEFVLKWHRTLESIVTV